MVYKRFKNNGYPIHSQLKKVESSHFFSVQKRFQLFCINFQKEFFKIKNHFTFFLLYRQFFRVFQSLYRYKVYKQSFFYGWFKNNGYPIDFQLKKFENSHFFMVGLKITVFPLTSSLKKLRAVIFLWFINGLKITVIQYIPSLKKLRAVIFLWLV